MPVNSCFSKNIFSNYDMNHGYVNRFIVIYKQIQTAFLEIVRVHRFISIIFYLIIAMVFCTQFISV